MGNPQYRISLPRRSKSIHIDEAATLASSSLAPFFISVIRETRGQKPPDSSRETRGGFNYELRIANYE